MITDPDFDKYQYSGCGIVFNTGGNFLLSNGSECGKNVIIFGTDISS